MRISLKLNAIEQEHLQELYDATGVARDELPFTEQFDKLCQDFQDRAFKNAEPEQVYAAMLRYTRSSTCSAGQTNAVTLTPEQVKQLRDILRRNASGGKVLPYSSEFQAALGEFNKVAKLELSTRDFWLATIQTQGRNRRPPRRAAAAKVEHHSTDDEDSE
jgi:hypothetical protein